MCLLHKIHVTCKKKKKKSYKLRSLAHSLYDLMIIYFPKVKWQQFKKFFPPFFFSLWKNKNQKKQNTEDVKNSISIYFYLCSAKYNSRLKALVW